MKLLLISLLLLSTSGFALDYEKQARLNTENHQTTLDTLKDSVERYLVFSSKSNYRSKVQLIINRVQQKINDNPIFNEQSALNIIVQDWFTANGSRFEDLETFPKRFLIEGCVLIKCIFDMNLDFPESVTKEFTDKDINDFSGFLIGKTK